MLHHFGVKHRRDSNSASENIKQERSISRMKLTAWSGVVITLTSVGVLVWLLGTSFLGGQTERATVNLRIDIDCPRQIQASAHVDPREEWIWISLLDPDIPPNYNSAEQNAQKRELFTQCEVIVSSPIEIFQAEISTSISGDGYPSSGYIPENKPLNIGRKDEETVLYQFVIEPHHHPLFAGEFRLKSRDPFVKDSFGKFHMGLSLVVRNKAGLKGLDVAMSLPTSDAQAQVIRPQPIEIGTIPVETYHFQAEASPFSQENWIDQDYFIEFVDPKSISIREGLLIAASTLLGAGISALLEVFLAGGISQKHHKVTLRLP